MTIHLPFAGLLHLQVDELPNNDHVRELWSQKQDSQPLHFTLPGLSLEKYVLGHFSTVTLQRELEDQFGHLLTEEMQCTLCSKQLGNYIKSKVWSHIGVTHDKTNEILASKGIPPIAVNIRGSKISKRKASDVFPEEVSPRFETGFSGALQQPILATPTPSAVAGELAAAWRDGSGSWGGGGGRNNCCRICGQVTQNRKRLLKHYCTRHFIDRLGALEYSFIVRNKCVECGRDFVGAKKSSKVIHIGVEHKQIFPILELEFGQSDGVPRAEDYRPAKRPRPLSQDTSSPMVLPSSSSPLVIPKANKSPSSSLPMIPVQHNLPRVQLDMSNAMMEIQARGNECLVCGKRFDLFRSMLLPHYCGHFYKEIAQGHEEYFTEENCKLCGATATKRKSRIIHLGVKHELVLPYIQEVIKMRGEQNEDEEDVVQVKEEDVVDDKDQEVEELGDSSLVEVKEESEEEDLVVRMDDDVKDDDEQEEKEEVQATEEERVVSRIIESVSQEISNGSVEKDEEEVPEGTLTPLPSSPPCITVPSPRPRTHLLLDQGTLESATLLKSMPAEPPVAKLVVPSLPAQKSLASKVTETLPTASSSVPSSPVPSQSVTKVLAKPDEDIRYLIFPPF